MRKSLYRMALLVAGYGLCAPIGVAAEQQVLPSEDDFFASVPKVSSAARLEKSLLEMGMSVTIIDREMIAASPAIEIPDLLRLVPGFQVAHATGSVFAPTYHGAADQWPRRMEVMIDGRSVYLNHNSSVEWAALGLAIEDIERIEVVRGGNAPSFGSNAMTGSINIITRAPFLLKGTYLRGTVGTLETGNVVARWGGDIGEWESSLTAQYRADEGFDKVNDQKRLGDLRFRGDYQATPVDGLSVQLGLTSGEVGADAQDEYFNPFRDRDIRSNYQQLVWNREPLDGSRYRLNLYHHYYHHDDDYAPDISGYPVPPTYTSVFPPGTTLPLGLYTATSERYDLEFQHNLVPGDGWRLAWGLGGRYDALDSDLLLGDLDQVERWSGRVFGSLEWRPVEDVAVSLDALTEVHEGYGSETSPRIAVNWLATDSRSFRASASRSFRVFTLLERYIDNQMFSSNGVYIGTLVTADGHDDFTPEQLTSYELGYSEQWRDLGLFLDVRLFREELEDSGVGLQRPGEATLWTDSGGGWTTKGFDVQLDYRPTVATRLVGAYSYATGDGRVDNELDASGAVVEYDVIDDTIPRHTFSALLSHQFDPQWAGSLALYYVDDMRWRGEGSEVDDYARLDLKLARNFQAGKSRGQLAFIVHNLTGAEYNEFRVPGGREGNLFDRRAYVQLSLELD